MAGNRRHSGGIKSAMLNLDKMMKAAELEAKYWALHDQARSDGKSPDCCIDFQNAESFEKDSAAYWDAAIFSLQNMHGE